MPIPSSLRSPRPAPPDRYTPGVAHAAHDSRRWLLLTFVLILIVNLPPLFSGWLSDDFIHRDMLTTDSASAHRELTDVYCFKGGPRELRWEKWQPWWQSPDFRLCYFRPLASLSLAFDHRVLPQHPFLAHLHGLLWFLVVCGAVYVLAARLLDPRTASLACLAHGVSSFSCSAVSWIAARHALVSTALAAVGLAVYVLARLDDRTRRALGGLGLLALASLGGEGALGGFGFVVAYELLMSRDPWRARLAFLAAASAFSVGFVLFYARAGYGVAGSAVHLDPLHRPVEFLTALPGRLTALFAEVALGLPADLWQLPPLRPVLVCGGLFGLLLLLASFGLRETTSDDGGLRAARFLGLGALLAAVPATAAILGGRVALLPAVGLSIVLAGALSPWSRVLRRQSGVRPAAVRLAVLILGLGMFVVNPLTRAMQVLKIRETEAGQRRLAASTLAGCESAEHFFIIGPNEMLLGIYGPYLLQHRIESQRFHQLTIATGDVELFRLTDRTLRLRARSRALLGGMSYGLSHSARQPIEPDATFKVGEASLLIEESGAAGVRSLQLSLPISAQDRRYCWLRYNGAELVSMPLPEIGNQSTIPYARGPVIF